jgi:hypothetical protein
MEAEEDQETKAMQYPDIPGGLDGLSTGALGRLKL